MDVEEKSDPANLLDIADASASPSAVNQEPESIVPPAEDSISITKQGGREEVSNGIVNASGRETDLAESTISIVKEILDHESENETLADHALSRDEEAGASEKEHTLRLSHASISELQTGSNELSQHNSTANEKEVIIFQPNASASEQEQSLQENFPDASAESRSVEIPSNSDNALEPSPVDDKSGANDPSTGYAYQGEATEMDDAVDEAPDAPLMMDPEVAPTIQETEAHLSVARDPLEIDGVQSVPSIDRSFTTNFTEVPAVVEDKIRTPDEPAQSVDGGWPTVGDDKTFGALLDDRQTMLKISHDAHPERPQTANDDWGSFGNDETFGELLGSQQVNSEDGQGKEDLAAIWSAALSDDELLPDVNDLDPSSFFGDDDEGFLEDDMTESVLNPFATAAPQYMNVPQSASQGAFGQGHARSAATPDTGLHDLFGRSLPPHQPRPEVQSAASFVDKSRGGYQSPYDLPMDVVKQPRQRPRAAPTASAQQVATPPPRSSSQTLQSGYIPSSAPLPAGSIPNLPQPPSDLGRSTTPQMNTNGSVTARSAQSADSGFFADLPVANKTRSRISGMYAPGPQSSSTSVSGDVLQQQQQQRGFAPSSMQPPPRPLGPPTPVQQSPAVYGGLTQPEQLPLLPDHPAQSLSTQAPVMPPSNQRYSPNSQSGPNQTQTRYSPAPAAQAVPSTARYSPAPTVQPGQARRYPSNSSVMQNAHPFAPRTSSPLAFSHERPQPQQQLSDGPRSVPFTPASPTKTNGAQTNVNASPERSATRNYSPSEHRSPSTTDLGGSPQRNFTRSPSAVLRTPKYSVQSTPSSTLSPDKPVRLPHRRQYSRDLIFVAPADDRAEDSLERWKGQPVFHWHAAGSLVQSFPKQTPFYAAGQTAPSVKCTVGLITTQEAPSFLPMDDHHATFPGPLALRSKGRKKDVIAWMTRKIEDLERVAESSRLNLQMDVDLRKRTEEKLILWKLVKIFVEHDGSLDASKNIEGDLRAVLLPNMSQMGEVMELSTSATSALHRDPVERTVIIQIRQALLEGQRERAVWLAEENKLWGHAMLIASTMGPDTWKQIVQSFVRSQVKTVGSDARALAALYQVFAGNSEECVDELVPPSARAGFKMVSKIDGTSSVDPLEGLDQWRETLGLVVSNRTANDAPSLLALGKMLSGYGRAEAAHSCFLFARQLAKHSGPDDAEAHFVLLGANHKTPDESCGADLDSILLTEIYEWAVSLTASNSNAQYIPHLQSFKLIHAQQLAAYGLKVKAQSYCDHITSAYTSTTRPSPYYHPTFTQSVNDLSAFLSQSPQSGPQSLLSKTAMNKVSSGAASWFTKFVAGDDDQSSAGTGSGVGSEEMMSGPFGRVNGDSPGLSRNESSTDLYNPTMGGAVPIPGSAPTYSPMQQFQPSSAPSRYTPAGKYAPAANNSLGISTSDAQRPSSSRSYAPTTTVQALDIPQRASSYNVTGYNISRPDSTVGLGSQGSYEPKPFLGGEVQTAYGGYQPHNSDASALTAAEDNAEDPFARPPADSMYNAGAPDAPYGDQQPSNSGYEPPTTGYEPPSYQPYEPDPEPSNEDSTPKSKKKSFMDDDDDEDLASRAASLKKSQADRAADDAFKKAAEADAARDKEKTAGKRGSWFGGLFKKDASIPQQGAIKAKLGEQNSFYFDEDLKKWVNKNAGPESAAPAPATPPPPKGPISRVVSGASGPPSGPPSRVSSFGGLSNGPPGRPPTGSPAVGPASGPPSRAGTPGAALDVGPPLHSAVTALNGEAPPSAPPSRPPTSMSNASSLDDLLGGPPGAGRRTGGTAKNKKKGGRYVDVMASS